MEFKKRLLAALAVVCVMAGLLYAGLSGMKIGEEEVSELFDTKETIYFWYSDAGLSDYINSAAVAFGEERDARVIPVLVSDSAYLEAINEASLHSEQIPDAFIISNDSLEKAYLAGLASRVTDTGNLCTTEHFPQTALLAVTYKDKLIAYPFYYETSAFLYNKTYLEAWTAEQLAAQEAAAEGQEEEYAGEDLPEAEEGEEIVGEISLEVTPEQIAAGIPSTMDEVLAFADNYDAPENVSVLSWDVSDIFYNYYFVGNYMIVGGESGDDDTLIDIYNDETKQCLEVYQRLNQFFFIESDTVSYDSVVQDFIEGKLVFTVATTDVLKRLEEAQEEGIFPYEYGIAPIPRPSADLAGRSLSVTGCVAVNGYSTHRDLANEFAAFLTGSYYEKLYERTGKASANLAANPENEDLAVFMEEYQNSQSLPKLIETSNFWIQLEILFSRVWEGGDIDSLLLELSDQIVSQIQ
ncbi:MAG: extracellular solute-binding protein [Lachnospiraceae bacterium]|nr:extracellular solute-binding protein [Lachnospiraceae bacterium]